MPARLPRRIPHNQRRPLQRVRQGGAKAKWEHRDHDGVSREYPNLAVQKFGGTKPQNISQLNSDEAAATTCWPPPPLEKP
jgi:hypothetical protein